MCTFPISHLLYHFHIKAASDVVSAVGHAASTRSRDRVVVVVVQKRSLCRVQREEIIVLCVHKEEAMSLCRGPRRDDVAVAVAQLAAGQRVAVASCCVMVFQFQKHANNFAPSLLRRGSITTCPRLVPCYYWCSERVGTRACELQWHARSGARTRSLKPGRLTLPFNQTITQGRIASVMIDLKKSPATAVRILELLQKRLTKSDRAVGIAANFCLEDRNDHAKRRPILRVRRPARLHHLIRGVGAQLGLGLQVNQTQPG